jgi:hypothetical protein
VSDPVSVFVSYSWGVERDTGIVDTLETLCKSRHIRLLRDNNEIKHGELIRQFMDRLTGGEHIITVFSKAYFHSKWCMYELLKTWQKGDFQPRTHPIIADDCDLQDAEYRIGVVKHWITEHQEIRRLLDGQDPSMYVEEIKKANLLRDISQNANEMMNFAAGRLTTPLADLKSKGYAQILDIIHYPAEKSILLSLKNFRETRILENNTAKKIQYLEAEIASIEETLHHFEMERIDAYHHAQKSALIKGINEKRELLKTKYAEYAQILNGISEKTFAEDEVNEVWKSVAALPDYGQANIPADMQEKLDIILQEIKAQNKSAAAKLKVALPIVPLMANYELELDTENFFGELWGKIRGLLKKKANNTVNPK